MVVIEWPLPFICSKGSLNHGHDDDVDFHFFSKNNQFLSHAIESNQIQSILNSKSINTQ